MTWINRTRKPEGAVSSELNVPDNVCWSSDGFGTTVRFVFNDEPYISNSTASYAYGPFLAKEFYKDHRYPLEEHLAWRKVLAEEKTLNQPNLIESVAENRFGLC